MYEYDTVGTKSNIGSYIPLVLVVVETGFLFLGTQLGPSSQGQVTSGLLRRGTDVDVRRDIIN